MSVPNYPLSPISHIDLTYLVDKSVAVEYHPNHGPHEKKFCHLSLPRSEEECIAEKIRNGVTMNHIIDEIRDCDETISKKHFITKKKMYNIMKKYDIANDQYHNIDEISVDLLTQQCKKMDKNPILMFKKQGEQHDRINQDEMFIVIMTKAQKTMLQKFSTNYICIDSTHNTNKYKYQLTTLVIIDEFGEGFPCAFCVSSNVNENTMKVFFNLLKLEMEEPIRAKVFMSDDAGCYYNAWKAEMTEVEYHLLCKWHVDQNFRKNLPRIAASVQQKNEVYKSLRILLEEPDKKKFDSLKLAFLNKLISSGFIDFHSYFLSTYSNRAEMWASCYRLECHLNTNMVLEAFHKVLKYTYLNARKSQRLDKLLLSLFKIVRDKSFQRLIKLEEGHVNHYIEKINKRHRVGIQIADTNIHYENDEWCIRSCNVKNLSYVVKRQLDADKKCDCRTKCLLCDTCIHEFSCNCHDYVVSNNLCKHIHAIINHLQNHVDQTPASDSQSRVLMEINTNVQEIMNTEATGMLEKDDCVMISKCEMLLTKVDQLRQILSKRGWSDQYDEKKIDLLNKLVDKTLAAALNSTQDEKTPTTKEPANKLMEKQFRFHSTTKERSSAKRTAVGYTKPRTYEEVQTLKKCLLNDDNTTSIMNIHTENDHFY